MDILSAVSETALITLKARVQEAEKDEPVIRDEVAQECLARIRPLLPIETQNRLLNRSLPSSLTRYIALRARKYDTYTKAFIAENRAGLVVSLGCGFDTRYWRVSENVWKYIEIDLPEVIEAKKKVLGDRVAYRMIGCSVLEEDWIEEVRSLQSDGAKYHRCVLTQECILLVRRTRQGASSPGGGQTRFIRNTGAKRLHK